MQIRLATPADAVGIQAIYAPVVASTAISFELVPPSVEEMGKRVVDVAPTHPWIVLIRDGEVAGYAYGRQLQARAAYRWSVETSVYVGSGQRGAGVGRALYLSLLEVLARQGYRQAVGGVALPNPASVRLHEACGYRLTGVQKRLGWKLGAWHDVAWFQREIILDPGPPVDPIDVDRLPPQVLANALHVGLRSLDRLADHP